MDGNIAKIAFEAGSKVKAGDLLLQQDTTVEEAQLEAAAAAVDLARINLARSKELLAKQTIAQSQLDTDDANYKQAIAQAANIRAVIAKKTIRAPFGGRLGIRLVNLGQTLKAGDPIVSLQALNPIYADFYLPQQDLGSIATGLGRADHRRRSFPAGTAVEGKVTAISPDVDSTTRNVRVEATLANADEKLHPGMFVDVGVVLPKGDAQVVIPSSAILYAPYGDSVFIVEDKKDDKTGQTAKVARQQFVRLGVTRGDFVAVISGVKAGDVVVSTGAFNLHPGTTVTVDNSLAPATQLAPTPTDS